MKSNTKKSSKLNINKYIVKHDNSLLSVLKVINLNQSKACIVLKNKKFLKVVTDGDIRRALIKGFLLTDKIEKVHNRKSKYLTDKDSETKILNSLNSRFFLIPILNSKNEIVDIILDNKNYLENKIKNKKICLIGLGYVGLTMALVLAETGFDVIGYDKNKETIKKLTRKQSPFYEQHINDYLNKNINRNLRVTSRLNKYKADIYIICVGTPIDSKSKKPNIKIIIKAISEISLKIKKGDLIILRSTLPTGFTRNTVIPIMEKFSNLKVGEDFKISFCPERTIEGKALEELSNLPQIIGGYDRESAQLSLSFFNTYAKTVIDVGSLEAAELCKLMDNSYRDLKFAYSNQISLLCEKLKLNAHDLISKVNLGYERNDISYPSPGVGGPCLSKDPYILHNNFIENKIPSTLTLNARKVNEAIPLEIYKRIFGLFKKNKIDKNKIKIFIIGFAFKGDPETSDMRDSTTTSFLEILISKKFKNIYGFDPVINNANLKKLNIKTCKINEGFKNADIVMFMNNHKLYSELDIVSLVKKMKKDSIFYDGWNIFKSEIFDSLNMINFIGVGK